MKKYFTFLFGFALLLSGWATRAYASQTVDETLWGTMTGLITAYGPSGNILTSNGSSWVSAVPASPTMVFTTSTRSIVTGTGATGFQVSATKNAVVNYSVSISTTATIGGASAGYITLEVAPANSATSSDWYEIGSRCRNDQTISLAVALQSVQVLGCSFGGVIPAGYYMKLRSVNVNGTPTYSFISGQEVTI